jgi:hypothetical protein
VRYSGGVRHSWAWSLLVVVGVAIGGCYGPSYKDCDVSCASGHGCPAGLTCDQSLGLCRTAGAGATCGSVTDDAPDADIDAPPIDRDGDGVPNETDNCPDMPNTDQDNEDRDLFGDVCDPCPPGPASIDNADADGVGNGCDPHPNQSGDSIVMFENFKHGMPSGANLVGSWSFTGDGAVASAPVGSGSASLSWLMPMGAASVTIAAGFTISAFEGNGQQGEGVGVTLKFTPPMNGIACLLQNMTTNPRRVILDTSANQLIATTVGETIATGTPVAMAETYEEMTTDFSCRRGNNPQINGAHVAASSNQRAGLYTNAVSVAYDWVMILKN